MGVDLRRFIRHPTSIPIEITPVDREGRGGSEGANSSHRPGMAAGIPGAAQAADVAGTVAVVDASRGLSAATKPEALTQPGLNVSRCGLALQFPQPLALGTLIAVRITLVKPVFEATARVAWCDASPAGFTLGAEFLDEEDEFRARMVEQVCYIEQYKEQVREQENRPLTSAEAAREWIAKFAGKFPGSGGQEPH